MNKQNVESAAPRFGDNQQKTFKLTNRRCLDFTDLYARCNKTSLDRQFIRLSESKKKLCKVVKPYEHPLENRTPEKQGSP